MLLADERVRGATSALFFLAFLTRIVGIERGVVATQLLMLGLLIVAMGLLSTTIVAIGAGRLGAFLRGSPMIRRWQGRFVGGIYRGLGIRLALQERRACDDVPMPDVAFEGPVGE